MKNLLCVLALLLSASAHADQEKKQKVDLTPDGEKAATHSVDPSDNSNTPLTKTSTKDLLPKRREKVRLASFCTDTHGMQYRESDPGYSSCLGAASDKTHPAGDANHGSPAIGITIGK